MANFGPLTAEIVSLVWGTPSKFQRVLRLGFVTAPTSLNGSQPNSARCLAVSLAARAGTLYIHFRESCPLTAFCQVQNSLYVQVRDVILRSSLWQFSYIGSVTARHSSSGGQPNFAAWYKEWNLQNFRRGRHLYSAGRLSRWAWAHILDEFKFNQILAGHSLWHQ